MVDGGKKVNHDATGWYLSTDNSVLNEVSERSHFEINVFLSLI